jgi:hypothetical protein
MSNKKLQKDFLDGNNHAPMYGIYQIKSESRLRDIRFTDLKTLEKYGKKVDRNNYKLVYAAPMEGGKTDLCDIYIALNTAHPADFTGHSLSVSDVVVFKDGGGDYSAFFVDSVGDEHIPDFMTDSGKQPRKKTEAEM